MSRETNEELYVPYKKENEELRRTAVELRQQIGELNSYIDGLEAGIKAQRRIIVTTGGAQK